MAGKRATSYDVAKLAGVSQSAVSRVFSPNGSASKKTRDKVMAVARELDFTPNPMAKSLSLGLSRLAGLVVTQYAQQNYPIALKSAVDVMTETGDSLLIQIVDASDAGDSAIHRLLQKHVDFIICAASLSQAAIISCTDAGVPLVMINRPSEQRGIDTVSSPNAAIMHDVAKMLALSGARTTVFLGGGDGNWVSSERQRGFVVGCEKAGLPSPILLHNEFNYDGGMAATRAIANRIHDIDAIVAANDMMAIGAIDVLRLEYGLKIPEDIQVVGNDDTQVGQFRSFQLTTIAQDMGAMFSKAIELATSRSQKLQREDAQIIIENKLIKRASTL